MEAAYSFVRIMYLVESRCYTDNYVDLHILMSSKAKGANCSTETTISWYGASQ
jgi:hypothetical protein